ncbi:protein translocase subunit SecD [Candidatus Marinimicrobia bacterium PRS2]|nr:protein translocase subunit SecD [Candidatus Marinimicrobia bacterium PRS2]
MFKDIRYRWALIAVVLIASSYLIWPTYKLYSLTEAEKSELGVIVMKELRDGAINLGLDLQGGMYVLLETDIPTLVEKIANKKTEELRDAIQEADQRSINNQTDFFEEFLTVANNRELRLFRNYNNLATTRDNESVVQELKIQRDNAIASALEIIRNRIDEFGVSEPTIQKYGANRIIVELAGVQDSDRARNLIQRTASLEFTLVLNEQWEQTLNKIDTYLLSDSSVLNIDLDSPIEKEELAETETGGSAEDIFMEENILSEPTFDMSTPAAILKEKPFSGYLRAVPRGVGVLAKEYHIVKEILENSEVRRKIPRGGKFLWSNQFETAQDEMGNFIEFRQLYFVSSDPEISGGMIREPQAKLGTAGTDVSGQWVVNLSMSPEGTKRWSRFTGANINRQVAIVLDDKVFMAPVIRDKIPSGQTQVTGFADVNEAKDMANVLRAGELPAPVEIIEERTVGPSLGSDSIKSGGKAMFFGLIAVMIFMIIYYKGAGLLATLALMLNLIMVMAVLAGIGATLTLPGIAGLILTIGMAVDANVIIFERIREELDLGKTVRAAIDSGYERAFITILDANVTTLIAAFVLAWVGSGPIQGFAVTLSTGIICSMFTAIFVTRTVFMFFSDRKPLKSLSI